MPTSYEVNRARARLTFYNVVVFNERYANLEDRFGFYALYDLAKGLDVVVDYINHYSISAEAIGTTYDELVRLIKKVKAFTAELKRREEAGEPLFQARQSIPATTPSA